MTDFVSVSTVVPEVAQEDHRAPRAPVSTGGRSAWFYILRRTIHSFGADHGSDLAASLTYHAVLSIFPALIALIASLGVTGQGRQATQRLLSIVSSVLPASAVSSIRGPLDRLTTSSTVGVALLLGSLVALWSASGYVSAFARSMNRIYDVEEGRPAWRLKPVQLLVTVAEIMLILVLGVLLSISGSLTKSVGGLLGVGSTVQSVWSIAKWPVIVVALVLVVALLYYATPNVRQPKFRWLSFGAFAAIVTLVIASVLFGLYVAAFSGYSKTYGSLAGAVVFLLWLWIANLALIFGAELDAELERVRELRAGVDAINHLQLPLRGTSRIKRSEAKRARDLERARGMFHIADTRQSAGAPVLPDGDA